MPISMFSVISTPNDEKALDGNEEVATVERSRLKASGCPRDLGTARSTARLVVDRRLDFGLRMATGQRRQRRRLDVAEPRLESAGAPTMVK